MASAARTAMEEKRVQGRQRVAIQKPAPGARKKFGGVVRGQPFRPVQSMRMALLSLVLPGSELC